MYFDTYSEALSDILFDEATDDQRRRAKLVMLEEINKDSPIQVTIEDLCDLDIHAEKAYTRKQIIANKLGLTVEELLS